MNSRSLILIAHNIRSCHNVGSILRTADGLGVSKVILSGYTPYPLLKNDRRLPHLAIKINRQINKTALGAQKSVKWEYTEDLSAVFKRIKRSHTLAALEQTKDAVDLTRYDPPEKLALVIGSEVGGIPKTVLDQLDVKLQIPMRGRKESFNVAACAAMALFWLINN